MPRLAPAYRGPAAVIGVGGSFAFVGTVPVAITLGLGVKTSATVIGVGFMGFGVLLILPGIFWCLAVQRRKSRWWRGRSTTGNDDSMQTPTLSPERCPEQEAETCPEKEPINSDGAVASYGGMENGSQPDSSGYTKVDTSGYDAEGSSR